MNRRTFLIAGTNIAACGLLSACSSSGGRQYSAPVYSGAERWKLDSAGNVSTNNYNGRMVKIGEYPMKRNFDSKLHALLQSWGASQKNVHQATFRTNASFQARDAHAYVLFQPGSSKLQPTEATHAFAALKTEYLGALNRIRGTQQKLTLVFTGGADNTPFVRDIPYERSALTIEKLHINNTPHSTYVLDRRIRKLTNEHLAVLRAVSMRDALIAWLQESNIRVAPDDIEYRAATSSAEAMEYRYGRIDIRLSNVTDI